MKVNGKIIGPDKKGSSIKIQLEETQYNKVGQLSVNLKPFFDFDSDFKGSVAFDFFTIAIMVYGIDNLLQRYTYSIDGWTREIDFTFPVSNKEQWDQVKEEFEKVLCFLTGDEWKIDFEQNTYDGEYYWDNDKRRKRPSFSQNNTTFDAVSLFSGGLDSLIGIVDYFEEHPDRKLLLVSHYDSNSGGPNADQQRVTKKLDLQYSNNYEWIQTGISLHLNGIKREPSYRSRSLMFVALGVYFASLYPEGITLRIPENGSISLNYPLTPSRRSSLSTRTTHPYLINSLQKILHAIGVQVILTNPYDEHTKGQMLVNSKNLAFINNAFRDAVSCGKRGRKAHWDPPTEGVYHCGTCMPCIYRRAALNAVGLDIERYGIDLFQPGKGIEYIQNLPDIAALIDYMRTPLSKEQIEANLLVNGSLPFEKLSLYADVVLNTKEEIKAWVRNKADGETKRIFGL